MTEKAADNASLNEQARFDEFGTGARDYRRRDKKDQFGTPVVRRA